MLPADTEATMLDEPLRRLGLTAFRPGQREVIEAVLAGRDVLCVMPTGGGKSLCYQLPALCLEKLTLVVSPLIALMKDQEDQMLRRGVPAAALHSGLDLAEQRERLDRVLDGQINLLYVAPERLRSSRFLEAVRARGIGLLAVDEAHCISEWGHDFRPDYTRLGWFRQQLGDPPTIALTATATDIVRRDIEEQLRLHQPAIFLRGFDRPNLSYGVTPAATAAQKKVRVAEILKGIKGSAIVYTSSRKACEEVADFLKQQVKRKTIVYHAGLPNDERRRSQDLFMSGQVDVIVATNAFGMGVDKPDIRAVIHYNIPGTLEAYYQEAGRSGRDGLPAHCELLFATADRMIQEYFIENEYPDRTVVYSVLQFLRQQSDDLIELTREEIKIRLGGKLTEMAIGTSLKILESAGLVERLRARQNLGILRLHETGPDLTDLIPSQAKTQRKVLRQVEALVGNRRGEDVYFHPDGLADSIGLDRLKLMHALKELGERLRIDVIPPFRGNATRLLDRDTPLHQLTIDFEQIQRQKEAEYAKLDRVIGYAQAPTCRRSYILEYFGDAGTQCGNCDNCKQHSISTAAGVDPTQLSDRAKRAVTIVLDSLAELRGRFGKILTAQTLTGSSDKKVERFGLKNRRCFGMLAPLKQEEVVRLLEAVQFVGLAEAQGDRMRPTIAITDLGQQVLGDPTLLPTNLRLPGPLQQRLDALSGLGPAPAKTPVAPKTKPTPPPATLVSTTTPPNSPPNTQPDYYWTWRLLDAGFDVLECSVIRGMMITKILDQAIQAADAGLVVSINAFASLAKLPDYYDQLAELQSQCATRVVQKD